jgi:three-Cys-motif partner protein
VGDPFFRERQPAAVFKHAILEKYLPVFVRKTGFRAPGNRVAYLDGYAGPGQYEDGSPGSPALAVDTGRVVIGSGGGPGRVLDAYFVEKDRAACAALRTFLTDEGYDWPVYEGDVEDHLDSIVDSIPESEPLFTFLDPFGLNIPLATIDHLLERGGVLKGNRRFGGAATEVLLNFSLPGLRRNAGHLTSPSTDPTYLKSRATILGRLDAAMGGPWWRDIWTSQPPGQREKAVLARYGDHFESVPGNWSVWTLPVADRWQGPESYFLIHLTQHPDGDWLFQQAVSSAMEVYRTICHEGMLDLEPLKVREAVWVDHIKRNISGMLRSGSFVVGKRITGVYGDALLFAREKHVRRAIKELHAEGVTSTDGKGDVQSMVVRPG